MLAVFRGRRPTAVTENQDSYPGKSCDFFCNENRDMKNQDSYPGQSHEFFFVMRIETWKVTIAFHFSPENSFVIAIRDPGSQDPPALSNNDYRCFTLN